MLQQLNQAVAVIQDVNNPSESIETVPSTLKRLPSQNVARSIRPF